MADQRQAWLLIGYKGDPRVGRWRRPARLPSIARGKDETNGTKDESKPAIFQNAWQKQ
jgi:hypothetical protein